MVCRYCGGVSADNSAYCAVCGRAFDPPSPPGQNNYPQWGQYAQPGNGSRWESTQNGCPGYERSAAYDIRQNQLYSDASTAKTTALIGLLAGIFVSRIAGIIIGGIAVAKINKCVSFKVDPQFLSTRRLAKAAVIVSSVLFALEIMAAAAYWVLFFIIFASNGGGYDPDYFYNVVKNMEVFVYEL